MFKLMLISIVILPVLLGMQAAKVRSRQRGLLLTVALVLAYDVLYLLMLYYLRVRWAA
jgi:inner membrane protein involved in colicin E2 resistance